MDSPRDMYNVQGEYTYLNAQQRELHTSGQSVSQASCHNYWAIVWPFLLLLYADL